VKAIFDANSVNFNTVHICLRNPTVAIVRTTADVCGLMTRVAV